jgi:hypothetical protein
MRIALLLITSLFLFELQGISSATAADRAPVVVELFTSEGCSSCPPAEALLGELAHTQPVEHAQIVPIAWHVDYFDHMGWKDPFSAPEYSQRQQQYAAALHTDQVYTPQMVVNGAVEFVGSDRNKAKAAINDAVRGDAASHPQPAISVQVIPSAQDPHAIDIHWSTAALPHNLAAPGAEIALILTEDGLSTNVGHGENAGRTLQHDGVVRHWQLLAQPAAQGTAALVLADTWHRDHLHAIILLQDPTTRHILAAGVAQLPKGP